VHFSGETGKVTSITTTDGAPRSPARACIEERLKRQWILPWTGDPPEGVSAVTVKLQELPGTVKGFD
jgi:hypothetical protein